MRMASMPRRSSKGRVHPTDNSQHEELSGPDWKDVSRLSRSAAIRSQSLSARAGDVRDSTPRNSPPVELGGLSGPGSCIEFSADGTRMAVGDRGVHRGNASINIWSLVDAVPQRNPVKLFVKDKVDALAFSPDGRLLASGPGAEISSRRQRGIVIWSEVQPGQFAADGSIVGMSWELLWELDVDIAWESSHQSCSLMFWDSARFLTVGVWQCDPKVSACKCGRVELWNVEAQAQYRSAMHGCPAVKDFLDPPRTLESFAYSPDYTQMVVGTTERGRSQCVGYVSILYIDPNNWHISPEVVRLLCCTFANSAHSISGVVWSADGHWIAAGCIDEVKVWNAPGSCGEYSEFDAQAEPAWHLHLLDDGVGKIAFSPDGHSLAVGGAHTGVIVLWDMETGAIARQWHCRPNIRALEFAPKAAMIAGVAGAAHSAVFFCLDGSIHERECMPLLPHVGQHFTGSKSSPYNGPLGVLSADGAFFAVAMSTNFTAESPRQGLMTVFNLSGAGDSSCDIVLTWDGGLKDLDVCSCPAPVARERHKHLRQRLFEREDKVRRRQLVVLLTHDRLHVWNLQTNAEIQGLPTFDNASHVAFSHDARIVIVIGGDEGACSKHSELADATLDPFAQVMTMVRTHRVKFSVIPIEALPEVQSSDPHVGRGSGFLGFKLNGGDASARAPPIHDQLLGMPGPVLAVSFINDGPADHEDVRHVVIAVQTCIALLTISLKTWKWEETTFPVQRNSTEPPLQISAIAAHRHNTDAPAWLIAGYGADQLLLWKIDENGQVFRIMALNVSMMDQEEPFPQVNKFVRTAKGAGRACGSAPPVESTRSRLRFGPLANSLTLATGQRLIVWEDERPGAPWSMTHDIRFTGRVWDCHYDQRQEAPVVGERKPRGVVVYDKTWVECEAPVFLVYDLFEYSLSFHLPDLCLLVQQFGPRAVEGRIKACPSLLTQRLFPQDLGWTLYHWAAFEGNVDLVTALCKEFKAHSESGSPFALDLYKQNALDYALRGDHFGIIDEFLQAAVQEPKMVSNLLPESHTALTKTVVKLLRHPVPMLAAFLDCACLLEPQVLNGELPQKAALAFEDPTACGRLRAAFLPSFFTESKPIRTTQVGMPVVTSKDVQAVAPSGDFEQQVHIRILCLRGALDKDIGLVRALCHTPNDEVLATQTVKIYLTHKWLGHGRSGFLVEFFCYILYLVLFTAWTFIFRDREPSDEDYSWTDSFRRFGKGFFRREPFVIFIQVVMLVSTFYVAYLEFIHLLREATHAEADDTEGFAPRRHSRILSACRKFMPVLGTYLMDPWNFGDIARILSVLYILIWDVHASDEVVGIAALCMWLRLLHFCRGFEQTGALVRSFIETFREMGAFLMLYFIFWIAFSHCFYILLRVDNFLEVPGNFFDAMVFCYRLVCLGESDIGVEERNITIQILFLASTFISAVVALNMLIAIMGDTYNRVQDDAIVARQRELSHLVYEFETMQRSSSKKRQGQYLLAAFRKERRPLEDVTMSELSMDQIRNDQRTFEKELRRQDHQILRQLSQRMYNVEQMMQTRADQSDQLRRSVHQLSDDIHKIQLATSRSLSGSLRVESQATPAAGTRSAPLLPLVRRNPTPPAGMEGQPRQDAQELTRVQTSVSEPCGDKQEAAHVQAAHVQASRAASLDEKRLVPRLAHALDEMRLVQQRETSQPSGAHAQAEIVAGMERAKSQEPEWL